MFRFLGWRSFSKKIWNLIVIGLSIFYGVTLSMAVSADEEGVVAKVIPFEKGKYQVKVERSHFVTMRDGVRLSTDLYFPVGFKGKLPVILERTPYDKATKRNADPNDPINHTNQAYYFASHGYVFAIQDRRGKYESEGEYLVLNNDVEDAEDTFNWLDQQPWFSGKASMIGCSIPGANQIKAAQTLHPSLASILPQSAATGHGSAGGTMAKFWLRGGARNLTIAQWAHVRGAKLFYRPSKKLSREEFLKIADKYEPRPKADSYEGVFKTPEATKRFTYDAMMVLPIVDIPKFMNSLDSDWYDLATKEPMDPWWDGGNYLEDDTKVNAAALHVNSWHDYGINETLLQYQHFSKKSVTKYSRDNQFVIISPLGHCRIESVSSNTVTGERNVGDARKDIWGTYLRWWDYTLKGIDNGFDREPKIQYYVPGLNKWKSSNVWPIAGTKKTKLYLTSDGAANNNFTSGKLIFEKPDKTGYDSYVYDPADPVFYMNDSVLSGSFDMSHKEEREDILVYTSEPLDKGIEMTGKIRAKIFLSTDVPDTDLAVKIMDVYPDGRAYALQEGFLRLRYREGFDKKVLLMPGKIYEIDLDMLVYSNYFMPGHKIRIDVTSSSMPTYNRNLNTGGDNSLDADFQKANVTIHHGGEYSSYIELPFIEYSGEQ
ncbi:CocE/NonD family hydrolase [Porticoccaceae bacterium LTM1]|nr:CocE/NonD family hydrolase [Porticoccaceae bacterium LTM1]